MATCDDCGQEMNDGTSCLADGLILQGARFARRRLAGRYVPCGDCGTPRRGFHHLGCDLESCPRCRGQLLGCGCGWAFDDDIDDDDGFEALVATAGDRIVYPAALRGMVIGTPALPNLAAILPLLPR